MGEQSKSIGEFGENIVIENFITKILGWRGTPNVSTQCYLKSKHNKITHGIDFLGGYECPLVTDTKEIIFTSIKYNDSKQIRSDFKSFCKDLVDSQECLKKSNTYNSFMRGIEGKKQNSSLVLFWLQHNKDIYENLINKIGNASDDFDFKFENIYFLDNSKVTFIYDAYNFVNKLYENSEIEYFYSNTGLNESMFKGRALAGKILPVQYLNSPVLPFKVVMENDKKIFVLVTQEKFEEDCFKRLVGLALNLTNGWCNKVIIAFPDYHHKNHNYTKDTVLLKFRENNFADMVEVQSYVNSFKNHEKNENIAFNKEIVNNINFNIEKMLPFGDQLRQLLTQSYIYKNDLQTLLRRRGIFIHKSIGKEDIIPLLMTTLISPSEFEYLRRKQAVKENAESFTSESINVDRELNWDSLTSIPFESIIKKIDFNIDIREVENFTYGKSGEIILTINTKHNQLTKEWAKNNTDNCTKLIFHPPTNDGDVNNYRIDIVATSKDSKKIGKEILKSMYEDLKRDGYLRHDQKAQKTIASDFTNVNRTKLIFSFMDVSINESKSIQFRQSTHIEFTLDETNNNLPDDILALKDKVEQSTFTGHNLHELKYITDSKYHDALIFTQITAEYNFQYNGLNGKFEVMFGFFDYQIKTHENAEFEFKIIECHPFIERNLTKQEYHDIEVFLKEEFMKIKFQKIEAIQMKYGKQLQLM